MVVGGAAEARRQRILLNRLRIKQENAELAQRQLNAGNKVQNDREDTSGSVQSYEVAKPVPKKPKLKVQKKAPSSNVVNSGEEFNEDRKEKKPDLDIPDSSVIIANVYRYLEQEYKYMRLINNGQSLAPLAGIRRRTAEATGVTRGVIKNIVNADKEGRLRRRNEGVQVESE